MTQDNSRLAKLKRKLAAREGKIEYADNVPALREEIARLEARGKKEFDL